MLPDYNFKFTDTTLDHISLSAYHVDGPTSPITNETINHVSNLTHYPSTLASPSTTLVLVGKGVADYGETIQQNLLYLLENFASPVEPIKPIVGQLWFNKSTIALTVYKSDNNWSQIIDESGGTITGSLNITSPIVNDTHAVNKLYVDNLVQSIAPAAPVTRIKTISTGTAVFTVPTYTPNDNRLWVFANGVKQSLNDDYVETNSTTITFNTIQIAGVNLEFLYV